MASDAGDSERGSSGLRGSYSSTGSASLVGEMVGEVGERGTWNEDEESRWLRLPPPRPRPRFPRALMGPSLGPPLPRPPRAGVGDEEEEDLPRAGPRGALPRPLLTLVPSRASSASRDIGGAMWETVTGTLEVEGIGESSYGDTSS